MAHYYDEHHAEPFVPKQITVNARGICIQIWSAGGIFSKDELDEGTKLLLDTCIIQPNWKVHDLGCGNGVVGVIVKLAEPSCEVWCSDVSNRAIMVTEKNAAEHQLDIKIQQSDGYKEVWEAFDTVLVNPPYVAGREVIYRLIDEACGHLKPGGLLQLVARHNKGGETLKKRMTEIFGNCDDSRRRGGFRLYVSRKETE